jgi:hypothetical protein
MKKTRFTEEQFAYAVRLAEGGTPVADVCRQIGISDAQGRMTVDGRDYEFATLPGCGPSF